MFIITLCFPVCEVINFDIYLSFLAKPFSLQEQKIQDKHLKILATKKDLKLRYKKALFII